MEWKYCVTDHRAGVAQNRGIEGTHICTGTQFEGYVFWDEPEDCIGGNDIRLAALGRVLKMPRRDILMLFLCALKRYASMHRKLWWSTENEEMKRALHHEPLACSPAGCLSNTYRNDDRERGHWPASFALILPLDELPC